MLTPFEKRVSAINCDGTRLRFNKEARIEIHQKVAVIKTFTRKSGGIIAEKGWVKTNPVVIT